MKSILLGIVVAVLFLALDLAWFRLMGGFFKSQVGSIARLASDGSWDVRLLPALLVYVLMTVGVLVFVVGRSSSMGEALALGGLFGFIGYGLYDLTNLATLSAWTVPFVLADMTWGTVLCGTVSLLGFALSRLPFFS